LGSPSQRRGKTGRAEEEERETASSSNLLLRFSDFQAPAASGSSPPRGRGPACREPVDDGPERRKLKSSPSLARQKWSANNVAGWAVAMGLERQRLVVKWAGPSSEFDYSPETSTFSFGTPPCPVRTIICRRCAQGHRRRSTATAAGPSLSVMRQDFGGAMHLMRILPG
jgi:hypothetical protein